MIKSIVFTFVGVAPPPKTPRVLLEQPAGPLSRALDKSPKSCEFPVVDIVINSIILTLDAGLGTYPPAKTPRVDDAHAPKSLLDPLKSPKSTALPVDAIVI